MSEYKSYLLRSMGMSESTYKQDTSLEESFDPAEFAKGVATEKEHTKDVGIAKKIALHHLSEDSNYYTRMEKCGLKEHNSFASISPTAKSPTVLGISIKGSPGGMMPTSLLSASPSNDEISGVDPKSRAALGGWEMVNKQTPNSVTFDETPINDTLESAAPVADNVEPTPSIEHPAQVQQTEDEPVQALTGTTDDGDDDQMGDKPEPEQFNVGKEDDEPNSEFGLDDEEGGKYEEGGNDGKEKDDENDDDVDMSLGGVTPKGDDVDVNVPDEEEDDEEGEEEDDEDKPHMVKEAFGPEKPAGPDRKICFGCRGSGYKNYQKDPCPRCNGSGSVTLSHSNGSIDESECGCKKCKCDPCKCGKSVDETFGRHLKLMKEKLGVKECKPCACDKPNTVHNKKSSKLTTESLQKLQEKFTKKSMKSPLTEQELAVSKEIQVVLEKRIK